MRLRFLILAVVVALGGSGAIGRIDGAGAHSVARTAHRSCGVVHVRPATFRVTVLRGPVRCSVADAVLQAFLSGGGTMHGPRNGPASRQSWTVEGWTCGHGAGGGACIRDGASFRNARDWIVAQAI